MVRYTAEELDIGMAVMQRLVDSCEWRHNQRLTQSMCRHLISLAQHGAEFKDFYAPADFWSYVDQPVSEDDDNTEDIDNQSGGANEEAGPSRYPTFQGIEPEDEPGPSHYHSLHGFQSELDSDEEQDSNRYLTLHGFQPELESDDEQQLTQYPTFEGTQQEDAFRPSHFYTIYYASPPVYARKFNTERKHYAVRFHNIDHLENADVNMESIFDSMLGDILEGFTPNDSTGLQINHPALDKPIFIPLTKHSSLNGDKILAEIMRVQQSKTDLAIDQEMQIITVSVKPPNGSGWVQRPINFDAWFKKSQSKITIKNNDNLCMARAIITAMAYIQNDPQYETIRHGDQGYKTSLQKRLAIQLMRNAGLADHKGPCGIPEAKALQAVIKKDCKLKIFAHDQQCIIYPTDIYSKDSNAKAEICLYLKDNHYDVITSLPGFFNTSYWCNGCDKGYDHKADHKCTNICSGCFNSPPCDIIGNITCNNCNRWFASQQCFDAHKKTTTSHIKKGKKRVKIETSICRRYKQCVNCSQFIKDADKKDHVCNSFKCPTCKKTIVQGEHKCYMQPLAKQDLCDNNDNACDSNDDEEGDNQDLQEVNGAIIKKYVFFDFETTQYEAIGQNKQGPIYKHTPNLCIAHIVCTGCRNDETADCKRCGPREIVFYGDKCQHDFCDWLFALGTKQQPIIALAHNAKGFDGQFIMQYLEKQGRLKPKIIDKGLELMCIEAGHVKIIDSLNFLPMSLKSMPKAFGIEELAKGYFPHLFNRPENYNYIGAWPGSKYYAPDSMKASERLQFEIWYAKQLDKTFDFKEEITKYCRSDVDILRRAVLKFQDIFIETATVDPFEYSLTIASACMRVFRTLFLKADTIGIIPHGGYRTKQRQSNKALKWLKWESRKRGIHIEHARNGGEYKVGNFLADGHHGNEIFEFNGCYWHGCPSCMKDRRQRTAEQQLTAEEAYTRTVLRRNTIAAAGYTVTEIWECDLERQLKTNPEMKQFFDSIELVEPMDPREAFYGGRTNAVQLYACIERDEEGRPLEHINYTDVCSLYPFICKYGKFPVGHPEIITENFADLITKPYEGVIKCRVVPPRRLLHPTLPYRSNGKLTFPLCGTCTDTMQLALCMHNDEERSILACWITMDIYKALELGYCVTKVYEVYHYNEVTQYDPATKTGGLFAGYIDMFVKTKQQADGWPSWVKNDKDKDQYINNYLDREGIQLEKDAIAKNPGLRNHAKLMLNSFWGKFGQRNNKRKTEFIDKPNKYFSRLAEAGRIIHSVRIINEHMLHVVSSMEDDFVEVLGNTNAVIAAYVTTQARLKLYSYIEQLDGRLIYFDTDSIIFKSHLDQPDQYQVPIGSYLGDMTNELKDYGDGAYIEEVASTGPKSYGLKIYSPETNSHQYIVKVKGFSLTSAVSKALNFETLKDFVHKYVLCNINEKAVVNFNQIARNVDHNVVTKSMCKDFRVVYTKRIVQSDFTTLPYGY